MLGCEWVLSLPHDQARASGKARGILVPFTMSWILGIGHVPKFVDGHVRVVPFLHRKLDIGHFGCRQFPVREVVSVRLGHVGTVENPLDFSQT